MNVRKEQLDITLDMDGVIADFEGLFCVRFGKKNRHMANLIDRYPEKAKEIEAFVDDRATYYSLTPEYVGVEIAKWLMQRVYSYGQHRNRANVTILTARPFRTYEVTKNWLKHENVPYHDLVFSHDKVAWMEEHKPDIIVDDIIDICYGAALKVPGLTSILVAHPWNEDTSFLPRISTLKAFQRIYQQVADEKLLDDYGGIELAEDISGA